MIRIFAIHLCCVMPPKVPNEPESDLLLIAESSTLIRSHGAAAFVAKTLSPEDSRIVVVGNSQSRPEM
jgi:hypothetical protein